jgi:heme-degrading monooxygenase HmoA
MYAVIFEVWPSKNGKDEYLKIAAQLKLFLENREGFISIERFQSLVDENKLLSLSFWEDEKAIETWRNQFEHRIAQDKGNAKIFEKYRIRVANVVRDYTKEERDEAPKDSNEHRI